MTGGLDRSSRTLAQASIAPFISAEVGDNNLAAREATDRLDDAWRLAAEAAGLTAVFAGRIDDATLPNVLVGPDGTRVEVSLRDVPDADLRSRPNGVGTAATTQGFAGGAAVTTMQDESPKPQSLYLARERYYNESAGSVDDRNGLLFTFDRPRLAFGAWFGDVETRGDGKGTPAFVRLLDARGRRIGGDLVIQSSTPDQSRCGNPADDAFVGCGNRTTRWIGFVAEASAPVKQMLVVVGDDDSAPMSDDAKTEHLAFTGATIADIPPTPTPSATASDTPVPTATATSSPTFTPPPPIPASATPTPSPTRTPTTTPSQPPASATATSTWTPIPRPIYLPVLLHETCLPAYVDVTLVLDLSTSMERPTRAGGVTKLAAAIDAARRFVGVLRLAPDAQGRGDRAAIAWFNATAAVEQPLTADPGALGAALDRLPPHVAELTRLDLGLQIGADAALAGARPGSVPVVVILTDGLPNGVPPAADGRPETTVLRVAADAKAAGVRIYTIGLGAPDDLDAGLLRAVASSPANYSYAPDAEDLRLVYANLAASLRCIPGAGAWRE